MDKKNALVGRSSAHVTSLLPLSDCAASKAFGCGSPMQPQGSPGSKAEAALLCVCNHLGLEPALSFRALSLLADRYHPSLGQRPLAPCSSGKEGGAGPDEWPSLLAAVGCVFVTMQHELAGGQGGQQPGQRSSILSRTYRAAGAVLGPQFEERFSSSNLVEAAQIIQQAVGVVEWRDNTVTYLNMLFAEIHQAGLRAFDGIEIDTCYTLLELLYSDGTGAFGGAIERGGKLMAAAIIAAAFCLAAPPGDDKSSLPFLAWLADLAQMPKEVIKSQSEAILQHVMG